MLIIFTALFGLVLHEAFGTTEVNENQTDKSNATYEEIKPNENTAHTNQHQTKLPKDGIKKQEGICDNMKP